jgi:multidrug efflux pump subunit AcrB
VGFAASTSGEYAGGIFWVVGAALIAELLVAVWFTPWLGAQLLPDAEARDASRALYDTRPYRALGRVVALVRATTASSFQLTTVAVLGAASSAWRDPKAVLPHRHARLELLVDVNLRAGAGFAATRAALDRVAAAIAEDEDAVTYTAYVGAGAPRFFLALNPDLPNEAFGKLVIQSRDVPARERLREKLLALTESGAVPEARLRVSRLDFGPPVGFPVQFRVTGGTPEQLRAVAEEAMAALRATPGTRDVQLAWGERAPQVRLELDQDRVAQLGLSPAAVAQSLQSLLSGATATQLREGERLVDVVLRAPAEERLSLSGLPDLTLVTSAGPVPLSPGRAAGAGDGGADPLAPQPCPFLTVRSEVMPGQQAPDVTAAAQPRIDAIRATLPPGQRITTGGATEESAKANASLFALFPIMVGAMLLLLMIQLRHFGRMALVMATAPLGIPGAAAALLLTGMPFGFVALLGVIALAGMIMRNTLILVDQVRQDTEAGWSCARPSSRARCAARARCC